MRGFGNNIDSLEREAILREALSERGLALDPELILQGNYMTEDAFMAMNELLHKRRDFDVVVSANDTMAWGVVHALSKHNLTVPYDVAVVGFDDDKLSRSFLPPLTTVRQPFECQAKVYAELLLRQMRGEPCELELTVPTELVVRGSCGLNEPDAVVESRELSSLEVARVQTLAALE